MLGRTRAHRGAAVPVEPAGRGRASGTNDRFLKCCGSCWGRGAPHLHCSRQRPAQSTGFLPRESGAFLWGHQQRRAHLPSASGGCGWGAGAEATALRGGAAARKFAQRWQYSPHVGLCEAPGQGNQAGEPTWVLPTWCGLSMGLCAENHTREHETQAGGHVQCHGRGGPEPPPCTLPVPPLCCGSGTLQ